MTFPHMLIPANRGWALARPRALRASSLLLCLVGLVGAVACSDNTGDDVIQSSRRANEPDDEDNGGTRTTTPGTGSVDEEGPNPTGIGAGDDDDESGIDDEDEIAGRSGGTRAGGGGGSRRRTNDRDDDDEELLPDGGVLDVDAGDVDGGVVEDAGVVEVDAGVEIEEVDAGGDEADAG